MKGLFIAILLTCISISGYCFESYYYLAKAESGDGVYALLRRYDLDEDPCNFQKFYTLNNLVKESGLKAGKEYIMPIMIVQYNGKSIRSTMSINDWDTAVSIKQYNESILEKKLRKTHYVDSKILWVPHHLAECQSSAKAPILVNESKSNTPATSKTPSSPASSPKYITQELFGEKYAKVEIKNQNLAGKVYYIVAGHGGIDPGARCTECSHTLCEDEYAYDVSLRLSRTLLEQGATVHTIIQDTDGIRDSKYLKCDTDETCMDSGKVKPKQLDRLAQRTNKVNELYRKHKKEGVKEQYAMFIHIDSNHEHKKMDVYFFHHEKSKIGKKLAANLQHTFKNKYAQYQADRGYHGSVKCRGLYVIANSLPPAILVELGNIKNPSDQKRITLPGNRQALAEWLADGFITFDPTK